MTIRKWSRALGALALLLAAILAAIFFAPWALAFPHRTQLGEITVYSEAPIEPRLEAILGRAAKLTEASAIAAPLGRRTLYLTDGGWRWALLSLPTSRGAFAVTRPLTGNIVVNRASIGEDTVHNNAMIANRRSLSGTIAHETTHLLIRDRYGLAAMTFPDWKVEGYCDFVAQESSLSEAQAALLKAQGRSTPALRYFDARRQVAAVLASGKSVDQLFRQ